MKPFTVQEAELFHHYICRGFSDPKRLLILYLLAERPLTVSQLTEALGVPQPTVSHHLRILRERGLVTRERHGQSTSYSLSDPSLIDALEILRGFIAELAHRNAVILQAQST